MAAAVKPGHRVISNGIPYEYAQAITKSDSIEYTPTRGIYVGGAGAVAVIMEGDGGSVTFAAVPAGTIIPVRATKILSTGTDATNIVALW